MNGLAEWQNFYVLVGSAAGALVGLQFILMALVADLPSASRLGELATALATPTVAHFSAALLVAAVMSAPWHGTARPALLCAGVGVCGAVYAAVSVGRMRRQTVYRPDLSDWLFYAALPLAAYAALAASGWAAASGDRRALFGAAAAVLALLFVGIRNAWDSVTYHVFVSRPTRREPPG